ncbi:uncharacterized protein B0H18DRAFT_1001360 [Fomitopsis serialis]|uniref:uncharacterized protein n=1 Tax=Fomitopsis serialis TaxID=139415 RepID=UPI002008D087|nr:uncharacterized protein B0H18DRAFT_1001360 [Neoantrodia serialis]KAH9928093.1 hypothetical protein B0H18DRAFT_1001360 [Neoantrodia serialis]
MAFLSPERGGSDLQREDSIDSGFAEGCFVPATFLTSPPRSPRRMSTFSILSSPFGSPTKRMRLVGEEHHHTPGLADFFSPAFSAGASQFEDADESRVQYSDVDSRPPSAEGEQARVRSSGSPVERPTRTASDCEGEHALARGLARAARRPSVVIEGVSPVRNDGFHDFFDRYVLGQPSEDSHISSDEYSVAPSTVSTVPTPSSLETPGSGSHVFTAPPRIWTPGADSDYASPLPSPFEDRPPRVFSNPAKGKSLEPQAKWERRASTRVPLAWRQSSSSGSLSRASSLRQSRVGRPRPPALTGLNATSHDRAPSTLKESVSAEGTHVSEGADVLHISPEHSAPSVPGSSRLKPLRLSMILSASNSASASPLSPSFQSSSGLESSNSIPPLTTGTTAYTPSSPTVSSDYSLSNARLLSSRRTSLIPPRTRNTLLIDSTYAPSHGISSTPVSAPISNAQSWHTHKGSRASIVSHRHSYIERHPPGPRPTSSLSHAAPVSPSPPSPIHAIATPRPTLLFALASDNIDEVKRVLDSGEAGPNDDVGPQSALAFTLTARQLKHRQEMVKLLLAHGADPVAARQAIMPSRPTSTGSGTGESSGDDPLPDPLEELDHATKYYIKRAEAPQTRRASALIHRSFFRPLARVRYDLIGQDRALEQLFRVLSLPTMAPVVVLFCGPVVMFGSLLEVPTHTVNMTTLRDTHDIWRSYSMSPYEAPSTCTLADFLIANEGRRCVVVLDEIEKSPNGKVLSSLLMPWELGRCSFEAGHRHVDVSQVIWLGTSNIGHDLVFEHQTKRQDPEAPMSREDYVDLMALLRPCVSQRLGASLLSRVTTVLPFIPFTTEEKLAIAAEALHSLTSEETELPPATIDMIVRNSLHTYIPAEGARSLYRAVSNLLLDTI